MGAVRTAVIYSSMARYTMRFVGLATTMVVSRLLTPEEIGTYAIAGAIVMLMVEFRLLGASNYLVRITSVDAETVRSVLGLTILISWGLGGTILLMSGPVADFYNLAPLATIFCLLSLSFFLAPYISLPTALLSRALSFKVQFRIRVTASIATAVTTVGLVLAGFSFYSLAIGQLMTPLTQFLILTWIRPNGMQYRPSFRNLAPVARFGIFNSCALLVRKATVTVPDMILGKVGSTRDVAMFSRGMGFTEFVSQTVIMGVQPVTLPYLSRTRREGGDVTKAYTRASVMLGAIIAPVLGVGSLASLPAIRVFFGDQWDAAAPLASWLALWATVRCVHWFASDALMAVGRDGLMLLREAVPFAVLVPMILAVYPYGLQAIAVAFLVTGLLELVLTTVILWRVLDLHVGYFARAWWSNLATMMACVLVTWFISQWLPFETTSPWQVIGLLALIQPIVWFSVLALCRNPLYFEIRSLVRSAVR